jgi:hypothetical protein
VSAILPFVFLLVDPSMGHHSDGMQAGRIPALACATLGLGNACKTVRKNNSSNSFPMPKVVCITQTNCKL